MVRVVCALEMSYFGMYIIEMSNLVQVLEQVENVDVILRYKFE